MVRLRTIGDLGGNVLGGDRNTEEPAIWDWLIEKFSPKTVLDVGCGEGVSTRYFRNKGLTAIGADGVHENCEIAGCSVTHDFTTGPLIVSGIDLVWCCEVLEHVAQEHEHNLIETISNSKYIAVTASQNPDGYHHVNLHPQEYWISAFEAAGCKYLGKQTATAKALSRSGFFAESGMIFSGRNVDRDISPLGPSEVSARVDIFKMLPVGFCGAEVGVERGRLARAILDRYAPRRWYMIDMWTPCDGAKQYSRGDLQAKHLRETLVRNIRYILGGVAIPLVGESIKTSNLFADGCLDVVYVDANHEYEACLPDLRAWGAKVRSGGIVAGHDIMRDEFGVTKAVSDYMAELNIPPDRLHITQEEYPSFWFIKS